MNESSSVVNMRTSAGKTRIAELAILQTLVCNPQAKILYIAPYRSLALEIEHSLSQVFDLMGYHVSHLYGGFRFSSADKNLANHASITIATPEKTRAIIRSYPELLKEFRLIIVDEGHLIGVDPRLVKNEIFLDHLRVVAHSSGGRLLLLSAVLPNPADLAEWVSESPHNVAKSEWKPSAERFGLLLWQGNRVMIEWKGEFECFNPSFVESHPIKLKGRKSPFPNNKNEAIAATAIRLTSIGPVMIFCGKANSISTMAKSVLIGFGENPKEHSWPQDIWDVFTSSCQEELGLDTIEYRAARVGVICHSNKLPPLVRMATERLMRSIPPKIIIATSTLAQGVNIGISSVIIASPYIGSNAINHNDFWNICGRAGRAFVDGEGKVLYAIDETDKSLRKIRSNKKMAEDYFNVINAEPVRSGLLSCLVNMRKVASSTGIDFTTLLGLVAENDFSVFGEQQNIFNSLCTMIDDALLAIIEDQNIQSEDDDPYITIDRVFRGSLAFIQAKAYGQGMDENEVVSILQHRLLYLINDCPDKSERQICVASGLPYECAKKLQKDHLVLKERLDEVFVDGYDLSKFISFVEWIENWVRINGEQIIDGIWPEASEFNLIRSGWIRGTPLSSLTNLSSSSLKICKDIYGYQLPWVIHAAAQTLSKKGFKEDSEVLDLFATMLEFGLPNLTAVYIFLAGIRSRVVACELALLDEEWESNSNAIRNQLCDPEVLFRITPHISDNARSWLGVLGANLAKSETIIPTFSTFRVKKWVDSPKRIIVRSYGDSIYLCTPDGREFMAVDTEKLPFDAIAND
ncbi:MAG: DEAD/DEAH box helicase, partial [Legionella sp.]